MKQKVIQTIPAAKNAVDFILGGINELGTTITFHYNVKDDIIEEQTNMIMANGSHEQAKQVRSTRRNALVDAINESQKKIRVVRDLLKAVLGYEYNDLWTGLGFKDNLAMPQDVEDVKGILLAMIQHLTANPTREVVAVGATATVLQSLLDSIIAAQLSLQAQEVTVKTLMDVREAKFEIVRKRIGSVYRELGENLDSMDRRWLNFVFNIPGADATPEQVTGVKVTLIGPTAAAVKWEAAVRASYYRIWTKVHGAEGEYIAVGSPADLDFTIENLPANATIDIVVTAVNNGGESPISEVITVTTH